MARLNGDMASKQVLDSNHLVLGILAHATVGFGSVRNTAGKICWSMAVKISQRSRRSLHWSCHEDEGRNRKLHTVATSPTGKTG